MGIYLHVFCFVLFCFFVVAFKNDPNLFWVYHFEQFLGKKSIQGAPISLVAPGASHPCYAPDLGLSVCYPDHFLTNYFILLFLWKGHCKKIWDLRIDWMNYLQVWRKCFVLFCFCFLLQRKNVPSPIATVIWVMWFCATLPHP